MDIDGAIAMDVCHGRCGHGNGSSCGYRWSHEPWLPMDGAKDVTAAIDAAMAMEGAELKLGKVLSHDHFAPKPK